MAVNEPEHPTYARRLGPFSATMVVVGGIIGAGIFLNPAIVAQRVGSAGLTLAAWGIGALIALAGALCFGELGSRRPRAGGGYVYLREAFGPLPAFLYGWALLLVMATGAIGAVAVTFARYTVALAGWDPSVTVPLAIAAILLLSAVNYVGVRPGAVVQNVFTMLKLAALTALILAGVVAIASGHHAPVVAEAAHPGTLGELVRAMGAALVPVYLAGGRFQRPRGRLRQRMFAAGFRIAAHQGVGAGVQKYGLDHNAARAQHIQLPWHLGQ